MEASNVITENNLLVYELPLTDAVRIALRLENLFTQFQKTMSATSVMASKNAMNAVLKVLEVTDRPDLKSKFSQTLTQYANAIAQFQHYPKRFPKLDTQRLQKILKKIEAHNQYLHSQHARIGESLRQNEFLSQIHSNLNNPGGICDYRLPAYILWQNKPASEKTKDLKQWMEVFQPLQDITNTLLELMRDSAEPQTVKAENGFYSQALNPLTPCHLIRVSLPPNTNLYPEFSAGKHRIVIHFLSPSYFGQGKPEQAKQTISFQLTCCKI